MACLFSPYSLSNLVSKSRASGAGAVNLVLNERVRELRASGHDIINFSFGQSPFPPMEIAVKALQDNANQTKYEPVKGRGEDFRRCRRIGGGVQVHLLHV